MTTVKEYTEFLKKHLTHSDVPISSSNLSTELEIKLNLPPNSLDSMLLGMALAQLNIKANNGFKPSPSGYPRKFRQFFTTINVDGGNVEIDKKKIARRKYKANRTRKLPKKYNSEKWWEEDGKFFHRDFDGKVTRIKSII